MQSEAPIGIPDTGGVPASPIRIRQDRQPRFNGRLHCHPEMELIYFRKGNGKQLIGDKSGHFKKGDLLLIGQNLAHYWEYPKELLSRQNGIESLVVHFSTSAS